MAFTPIGSSYVTSAQLQIGTTIVKQYTDAGTHQSSVPLTSYFDSTHFADGSTVPIQMTVTDSGGFTYTAALSGKAYNKAYALGNDRLDGGELTQGRVASGNAATQLGAMNHTATRNTSDTKPMILNNLPVYTAFYTWTHGGAYRSQFGDCLAHNIPNDPMSTDANYLFATASDDTTGAKSVTQTVGGKTLVQPPYNFVFIDSCDTAQSSTMAGAFGITTSSPDLAYLGYTTESDDSPHNSDWSNQFFTDLASGYAVEDARQHAIAIAGYPLNTPNGMPSQHAETYVWGDKTTKVHGVYGGTSTQWFR